MDGLPFPINIKDLISGHSVEWERLEFKKGWNPEKIIHTICAFANDIHNLGGGYIIIGIEEKDGKPILPPAGLDTKSIDRIQKELLCLCKTAISPDFNPLLSPVKFQESWILVIWAPGGPVRPYKSKVSLSKTDKEWAYYIRKASSTVKARGEDESNLISLTARIPFDDRINIFHDIEELSRDLIIDLLKEVKSDLASSAHDLPLDRLGRQMNIIEGPSESPSPKNVGLLFFNDNPHEIFPYTQIDVVWFPEGPEGDRFSEKIFLGPLNKIIRESLEFIKRNYLFETVVKRNDRPEADRYWNFPYPAIEEAVVNAVYHRSYEIREPIEIRISREDLIVLSYPGPDRSVDMDDLKKGKAVSRRYRNRRIGEFLKELELTEGRSTGIPKILRSLKENNSPPPEFKTDEDRTYYYIKFNVNPEVKSEDIKKNMSGAQLRAQSGAQSDDRTVDILKAIKNEPKSTKEIMDDIGLEKKTGSLKRTLKDLLEKGMIEYTIPEKPRSRLQKYRITVIGRNEIVNK